MATTYSASVSAYVSGGVDGTFAGQLIKSTQVPDTSANGLTPWNVGGVQNCLRQGEQILCKGPDGGQHWYRIRAGSDPTQFFLDFVGP
jgi:hypothetical protein